MRKLCRGLRYDGLVVGGNAIELEIDAKKEDVEHVLQAALPAEDFAALRIDTIVRSSAVQGISECGKAVYAAERNDSRIVADDGESRDHHMLDCIKG